MKQFSDQTTPFAAKVSFFDKDAIRDILGSLIAKYYRACGKEDDDETDVKDHNAKVESFGDMRDCVSALMSLFCGHEDFETDVKAHASLKRAQDDENTEQLLDLLTERAQDLVALYLDGQEYVTVTSSTPQELLFQLQPFTYQLDGIDGEGTPCPWPLVKVIEFGLDHPLLNEGIIFVDSPGLSDANTSRSKNAVEHHRLCTHKIAVAEIGRAEADAELRKNLAMGYLTRGSGNTMLVLTHGDQIDSETEVTGTVDEKRNVARLKAEVKEMRADAQKKSMKLQQARLEAREEINDELASIRAAIKLKEAERDSLRLSMRNQKVQLEMQKIYKALTHDPKTLATFAVGNMVYTQHLAGYASDEKPALSIPQTGIPQLRRHLYLMPAEGRLNEIVHVAQVQLPILANSLELFCSKTHMARKGEIEKILLEPKQELDAVVQKAFQRILEKLSDLVLDNIKQEEPQWTSKARNLGHTWGMRDKTRHWELIKGDGKKKWRKASDSINWNAELIELGKYALDEFFRGFQGELYPWVASLAREIHELINRTRDKIRRKALLYLPNPHC